MRSVWNQIPMVRITLAVMAGIAIEIYADTCLSAARGMLLFFLFLMTCTLVLAMIINLVKKAEFVYRARIANGVALLVLLVCLGYVMAWLYMDKNYPQHFKNYLTKDNLITAEIVNPPMDREKLITAIARVNQVSDSYTAHHTKGKILINLLRDSLSRNLKYGDVIVFHSKIEEFEVPKNPAEFNFKLYQSFHNIYYRTFLKPGSWIMKSGNKGNVLMSAIFSVREYFLSVILHYVKDKNDFAVASAIMLGYNDYMNGDITRAYASSGTLHVLSVSGLHVGIMFLMLNFMLKWMDNRSRKFIIAKGLFIIGFIWFYACLTGLSPSVLRSAMMFSMIQLGRVMIRNVNTYNVIFASALLLILFNPMIVTEVGFMLSYLAVIGIIYLQPKIYSRFVFRNWVLDQAWMIVSVSIAAQVITAPLSLFYFHQFPNLFLICNLVVIPLSNLILFNGTGLFAISKIPYLSDAAGWSFEMLLRGLNKFIFFIDQLSFALIQGISISMYEMIALYAVIFLLCWFIYENGKIWTLLTSLLLVLMLSSFNSY